MLITTEMDTIFIRYMDARRKVFRTSKKDVPKGVNLKVDDEQRYVEDRTGRKTTSKASLRDSCTACSCPERALYCSIQNLKHCVEKQYFTSQVVVQFADGVQTCCSKYRSGKPCSAYPHIVKDGKGYCRRHKPKPPKRGQQHSAQPSK